MGRYGRDVTLEAELVLEVQVEIQPPMVVGQTFNGYLKVIPIAGGTFQGEQLRGEVIAGGADWNTVFGSGPEDLEGIRQVFAKYTLKTEDGAYISVENEGWKAVDQASATAIATVPKLRTADPRYHWLNYGVYVGSLTPRPDGSGVTLRFYRMK